MSATAANREFESIQADPTATPEDVAWDAFLAAHPFGHHEQSSVYGQLRKSYGFETERVVLHRQGRIVGGAQVLWRRTPIGRIAVVKRGPLARDDDPAVISELVQQLDKLAQRRKFAIQRVETFMPQQTAREALAAHGFEPRQSWGSIQPSVMIRLDGDDDGLLARMTHKGRYNIRRAERFGVEVRIGDAGTLGDFYQLHANSADHQDFAIFDRSYFEYLLEVFGPSGHVQQFIAYHRDQPVAALFNTIVGDYMLYGWGGIDRGDEARKLMANYLLHFQAMSWARKYGCKYYDMVGISEQTMSGLTQFKTRIAPERIRWPATMWKFYGPLAPLRSLATEVTWARSTLRSPVLRAARRLGLRPQMPW